MQFDTYFRAKLSTLTFIRQKIIDKEMYKVPLYLSEFLPNNQQRWPFSREKYHLHQIASVGKKNYVLIITFNHTLHLPDERFHFRI